MKTSTVDKVFGGIAVFWVLAGLSTIPAWVTHVVWIIRKLASDQGASFGQIALGAFGAFMPPVGVIHGYLIWFGLGF